jgi:hypothetical protein
MPGRREAPGGISFLTGSATLAAARYDPKIR